MAYFTFKADLKARKECNLFKNYYLCKRMCDRCAAIQPKCPADTNHPMVFKDMRPTAPYRTTTVSHAEYLRTASRISPWAVVKGWSLETTSFDLMHMIFLGIARDYVPSCLKILRLMGYHYEPGETDEEFLRRTSWEMKLDCKSYGSHGSWCFFFRGASVRDFHHLSTTSTFDSLVLLTSLAPDA